MNNQGFTLVEVLLNLLVVSFLCLLLVRLPVQEFQNDLESRLFFERLEAQLNLTQQEAIVHRRAQKVFFDAGHQEVKLAHQVLPFPLGWSIKQNFIFYYLANGRINQFKTVSFFHTDGRIVRVVFQLGSGKFEIQS